MSTELGVSRAIAAELAAGKSVLADLLSLDVFSCRGPANMDWLLSILALLNLLAMLTVFG